MSTSCSQNADQLRSADYAALLEGAVVSIFSTVADIELLSRPTDPATETSHNSITVILNFGGHEQGFLALNCSDALAGLLAINMSGDTEELSDSYLCGALSETAHIIVTSLFENMPHRSCHTVSNPAVIRGDDTLVQKLTADPRGYTCSFFHGTGRVLVKLVMHPSNCLAATIRMPEYPASALHQAHRLFSCPRFGHQCRQLQHTEPSSPHTVRGIPYPARPGSGFLSSTRFDCSP